MKKTIGLMCTSMSVPREVKVIVTTIDGKEEVVWQQAVDPQSMESLSWTWERPLTPNGMVDFGGQHVGYYATEEIVTIKYHHPRRDV